MKIMLHKEKNQTFIFIRLTITDIEGFKCGKKPFFLKKFLNCSANTIDTFFLPLVQFFKLSKEENKIYKWVPKFLHRLPWDEDDYACSKLHQFCSSNHFKNPNSKFVLLEVQ